MRQLEQANGSKGQCKHQQARRPKKRSEQNPQAGNKNAAKDEFFTDAGLQR